MFEDFRPAADKANMRRRIVICSRHSLLIAGLRVLVAEPAGLAVVECPELDKLRASLEQTDLVLIDVETIHTLECLADLKPLSRDFTLILWVGWISPEFIREAIDSGVRGILRKDASVDLYRQCLEQVAAGQVWLDREMSQRMLGSRTVKLSPRERQLVGLLTEGLRNKEIAMRMNITEGTAKVYLSRLFEKTGASDRFELAMFVLNNLEPDSSAGPSRGPRIFLPLRTLFSRRS